MNRKAFIVGSILLGAAMARPPSLLAAFSRVNKFTIGASATTSAAAVPAFVITVPTLLPTIEAFSGKNVVIPVKVTSNVGPIQSAGLSVSMTYQLYSQGTELTSPVPVPITFSADPTDRNSLIGRAIINSADLSRIQNSGQLVYVFTAKQNGAGVMLNKFGSASAPDRIDKLSETTSFTTDITNHVCRQVDPAKDNVVRAMDLFVNDGKTAVSFAKGAVASPGNFCIDAKNPSGWPPGPGGKQPVVVYTFTLNDTSLAQTALLSLSYPTDPQGNILNSIEDPNSLAIYWLGPEGLPLSNQSWHLLSRPQIDTTLHTVTGVTSHFSTYALFASGEGSNADLRPKERIITPNGDNNNDTAQFGTGIDQVKIFDIRGRRIKTIPGPSPKWDGTDDSGAIVESGVYLYQFTANGDRVSGVIGVAK